MKKVIFVLLVLLAQIVGAANGERPRVVVTTDGEADDRCSMVRFLLSCNEFEVEAIVNSSSQFHWQGGTGWSAFHEPSWIKDYIKLYGEVYDNLKLHDPEYPTPEYLLSKWKVGNIEADGEMEKRTEGAEFIAEILLDDTDDRPVWLQAWGGCNTIARALKIIEQDHPAKMAEVAGRMRMFLIWEQDQTYQSYIRPSWEKYNIPTIISDQFDCMAYIWNKVLPEDVKKYYQADFMSNIVSGHGAVCDAYDDINGAFHAEGDTPAFLHCIPNGLRSMDLPGWGGWGGRYVLVRNNVWMDPKPDDSFKRPTGRWGISRSWSKNLENRTDAEGVKIRIEYFRPIWRWMADIQNDFAARADWCVKPYGQANHHPKIKSKQDMDMCVKPGEVVKLDVKAIDPDDDTLSYKWWQYVEAGSYKGDVNIQKADEQNASFVVPDDMEAGETLHIICEVSDDGVPPLKVYKRVVINNDSE